ncbi:MAG: M23 family metallopeptidase [Spirochaetes bacterium]|nr:M23 family metallopeptidase [Spirochaetota bacterium]
MNHRIGVLTAALVVSACFLPAQTRSDPVQADAASPVRWLAPKSARQGDPVFVWAIPPAGSRLEGWFSLITPGGTTAARVSPFPCPVPEASNLQGFALGVSTDGAEGEWILVFEGGLDGVPLRHESQLKVQSREFPLETIKLSPTLTKLRTAPDPKQAEESKAYIAILESFDPAAVFLRDSFILPTVDTRRTSTFGDARKYIYSNGKTSIGRHLGLDLSAPRGTPVFACGTGRVAFAGLRILTGNTVILEHLPGVYSICMHMDTIEVAPGDVVRRGARIGTVGSTGFSTGPHLHWELRVAMTPCDPEALAGEGPLDKARRLVNMNASSEGR